MNDDDERPASAARPAPPAVPRQLGSARGVARLLDRSFRVPGTSFRFGLDPILGLLPVGGDVLAAIGSGWILFVAWRNGAPPRLLGRMLANVALDTAAGAVPVVGDLFDAGWKSNSRNLALLEAWLGVEGPRRPRSRALLAAIIVALVLMVAALAALLWLAVAVLTGR